MSEQTETVGTTEAEDSGAETKNPTQPLEVKEETFREGAWTGFKFFSPQFGTVTKAVEHFGESNVLSMLNSAISARLRTKVKNGLPKNLKPNELTDYKQKKLQEAPDGVLFNTDAALKWKPDQREESSNSIMAEIKKAMKESDFALVNTLFAKYFDAVQRETGGSVDIASLMAAAQKP